MIVPFKNRSIDPNQRVRVYRNLHRGDWSIADARTGKVLAHATHVSLRGCVMRVSESGRLRAVARKQRNVHAWIEGVIDNENDRNHSWTFLRYNPFRSDCFHTDDGCCVRHSPWVSFGNSGTAYVAFRQ